MTTKKLASVMLENDIGKLTFGMFLRSARLSMGLSQSELGKKLGVTKSVICDIEKGRQTVSPTLAVKIAKGSGLSVILAVKLCLQDQLDKAKIKVKVELLAA
jgi:transcriptional regulator with XRE-family HTH domain